MIHIIPPHLRAKPKELPQEKTYSYSDVERFVLNAINVLRCSELLTESGIEIKCFPDDRDRGVRFDIRKEGRVNRGIIFIERSNENAE